MKMKALPWLLCAVFSGVSVSAQARVNIDVDIGIPLPGGHVHQAPPPPPPPRPSHRPSHSHHDSYDDGEYADDSYQDEGQGQRGGRSFNVPPDRVPPRGACKVWFTGLPPDRQSPPMNCGKARADARRWGGMVIWASGPESYRDGRVAAEDYGPHRLHGVPPDRLPPPGMCRVWRDNAPPDRQARPESCASATHHARQEGGRVLYMPGP